MIVRIGSATPATFLGENLIIANKGLLQSVVASTTSTVNNLTLNAGGLISNANGGVFVISLNGKTFTLNGGALTCQNANRTTNFRKGSLAGSGTVDITCQSATFYGTADFSNTLAADAADNGLDFFDILFMFGAKDLFKNFQRYVCGASFNNIYFCGIWRNIRWIFQDFQEVSFSNKGSHGSFIFRIRHLLDMESMIFSIQRYHT